MSTHYYNLHYTVHFSTIAHLPISGSWLSSAVTVEERRYGLRTTRLPDLITM